MISIFDDVQANPTCGNVEAGLKLLRTNDCDFVISLGGGSPHDCAIKAIELIKANLIVAVDNGQNIDARDQMAYAQFLAGMAFNNASLSYVHAMAHQLGGFYDLPHGVCNALLLPHVQQYNARVAAPRLKDVAKAMGVDVSAMSDEQGATAAIAAIQTLAAAVKIPENLTQLGVKAEDIPTLAENALKDACGFTNPKQATHAEICQFFTNAL